MWISEAKDMKKIAVVGKNRWERIWSNLAGPFVSGEVKYYEFPEIEKAREWILQ